MNCITIKTLSNKTAFHLCHGFKQPGWYTMFIKGEKRDKYIGEVHSQGSCNRPYKDFVGLE